MAENDPELPTHIGEWAEACRAFVKESVGIELDYTQETLPILDHYVRTHATGTSVQRANTEIRDLLTPPLGAYFGEVVRRNFPGVRWHAPGEQYEDYRLEFDGIFLHFNPLGVAAEALAEEDAKGYGAHFQILDETRGAVESVLEQHDAVSSEDYYSFTIRYETLESLSAALRRYESEHAAQPRRFGRDVYRAASGEISKGSLS
jgi:hypothetical protein